VRIESIAHDRRTLGEAHVSMIIETRAGVIT